MDRLISPDTFEFLAQYFLAGWVFLSVRSWWVRGERPKPNEVLFEAITLSLLNQLLALVTMPVVNSHVVDADTTASLICEVLVQPAIVGLFVGWFADRDWIPPGFRRLFMPSVKPVTLAFDFAFDQLTGPAYLVVSFADERIVYGYFGEDSFANGEDGADDLYFEKVFELEDDGTWIDTGRAAWVSLIGVQSIEIIPEEDALDG